MKFANTAANRGKILQACDEIRRRGKYPYRYDTATHVTIEARDTRPAMTMDSAPSSARHRESAAFHAEVDARVSAELGRRELLRLIPGYDRLR